MTFPPDTISGRKVLKDWINGTIKAIETESKYNYALYPDWLPLLTDIAKYMFRLEERITILEDNHE